MSKCAESSKTKVERFTFGKLGIRCLQHVSQSKDVLAFLFFTLFFILVVCLFVYFHNVFTAYR